MKTRTQLWAFYLPQFHPIPENDTWWGKGFTEWSNVRSAKAQFNGHRQPKVPRAENYYDLRDFEVLKKQSELAQRYGIHGFVFYHYWFHGKRLLEKPVQAILQNRHFSMPFCFCWANESWSRRWDGRNRDLLIEQSYSLEDDLCHIRALLPVFKDERYFKHQGRPVLIVYRSEELPDSCQTVALWRAEVKKAGFPDLYLLRVESLQAAIDPAEHGFDAAIEFAPDWRCLKKRRYLWGDGGWRETAESGEVRSGSLANQVFFYEDVVREMLAKSPPPYKRYYGVFPAWDNYARRQKISQATIIHDSTPAVYQDFLAEVIKKTKREFTVNDRLIFINAWNEWGEGCFLEPDQDFNFAYLEATAAALDFDKEVNQPCPPKIPIAIGMKTVSMKKIVKKPLVSILIPAYNHATWINETLASVLQQSLNDFEVIVVDDGSVDQTAELVAACTDDRVQLVVQENRGTAAALNRALELSRGRYIAILNSDDLYLPGRLAHFVEVLEAKPEYSLAFSRVRLIDGDGKPLKEGADYAWLKAAEANFSENDDLLLCLLRDNFICTSSNFFFRRSLIPQVGAFRPLRYVNDLDFLLRALRHHKAYFSEQELLAYRLHSDNTMKEKRAGKQVDFLLELSLVLAHALYSEGLVERWDFSVLTALLAEYYQINLETLLFLLLNLKKQGQAFQSLENLDADVINSLRVQLEQLLEHRAYTAKLEEGRKFFLGQVESLGVEIKRLDELVLIKDREILHQQQLQQELWDAKEWYRHQQELLLNSRRFRLFDTLQALRQGHNLFFHSKELARILLPSSIVNKLRGWRDLFAQNLLGRSSLKRLVGSLNRSLRRCIPAQSWSQQAYPGPLLSIILPCFNHGLFLENLHASLAAQTYSNFEVILLDDGSTDLLTREKVAAIERHPYPGWKVIRQENCGVIGARNRAIKEARGKYVFPLDTDDTISPTFIEKCLLLLESLPDHYFVYSWSNIVGDDPYVWKTENSDPLKILSENRIGAAVFPRRAWLEAGGYNEIMRGGYEDWEFYANLIRRGYVGLVIPEALYNYRMLQGSRNDQAAAEFTLLRQKIRSLHLGFIKNHCRSLRHRAWQRYKVENSLINLVPADKDRKQQVYGLDLKHISKFSVKLLPALMGFVKTLEKPLVVTADLSWQDFFHYNQKPCLWVYFPENYHSDGDPQAFHEYLLSRYQIELINPETLVEKEFDCGLSEVGSPPTITADKFVATHKLRILYIAPWLITGGADTMMVDWFQQLDSEWCEKFLVTTLVRENLWLPKVAGYAREIYDLPALHCREPAMITDFLLDFIAQRRIDILHIMNSEIAFHALPQLKERFPELKVVAQFHCFDYLADGRRTGYAYDMPRRYGNFIDAYNIEYDYLGEEIVGFYPYIAKEKFTVIHGRVDSEVYSPRRRTAVAAIKGEQRGNCLNLLFIGRLDRQKQPLRLVAIASALRVAQVPFVLHIVGDGNLESQKKELQAEIRQQGLEKEVCLHGEQPLATLYDWYQIADILLLTSDWEGVPMVLYQAMAMAVVPVVAEVGGCVELVTPACGYLVAEKANPEAYVSAIKELLDDQRRQAMASQARQRMLDHFSLVDLDREYKSFYGNIVK